MNFFKNPNYDFVRWRWHAIALSLIVILAGMSLIATRGLQKGVDFEGGTIVILKFDQRRTWRASAARWPARCPAAATPSCRTTVRPRTRR